MRIVFATTNKHKALEAQAILEKELGYPIEMLTLEEVEFIGDITEGGKTFEENAFIKASVAYDFCRKHNLKYGVIADDSGLSVDALGGEPGIYSARYAALATGKFDNANDEDNINLLLKNMEGQENRKAKFVCSICYIDDDKRIEVSGECSGEILTEKHGASGFGYDPVFYYPEMKKTLAEMSADEKNKISHRKNALHEFCKRMKE